jgi:Rieske Fe-S protein
MTDQRARTEPGSTTRRSILRGAAVAGAALPFLAACGGDSTPESSGTTTPTGGGSSSSGGNSAGGNTGGGEAGSSADVLTTTSKVPEGGGVILPDADGGIVITQPAAGDFKGFTNICTHMGCPVDNVSDGTINCLCHGSQYSIEDGSVVTGPAPQPLAEKPITVKGKQILAG